MLVNFTRLHTVTRHVTKITRHRKIPRFEQCWNVVGVANSVGGVFI